MTSSCLPHSAEAANSAAGSPPPSRALQDALAAQLKAAKEAGTYKNESVIVTPQGVDIGALARPPACRFHDTMPRQHQLNIPTNGYNTEMHLMLSCNLGRAATSRDVPKPCAQLIKTLLLTSAPACAQYAGVQSDASPSGRQQVLNFCANNYLGLSNHPRVVAAAAEALRTHGYGLSSVRFICGTQDIHKRLEERISAFHGTQVRSYNGAGYLLCTVACCVVTCWHGPFQSALPSDTVVKQMLTGVKW